MDPSKYDEWLKKEDAKWENSRSVETKEIFNLLKDGKWHCRNCDIQSAYLSQVSFVSPSISLYSIFSV